MQQTKILLINFPGSPIHAVKEALDRKNEIVTQLILPLGLLYLSSNLKKLVSNVDVRIIDYARELELRAEDFASVEGLLSIPALEVANDFQPDIIGYSMMFSTCHPIFNIALTEHKKIWPDAVTIAGGNHATNAADVIMDHHDIDYIARGECELAFAEFVQKVTNKEKVEMEGIYHRDHVKSGKPMIKAKTAENLDDLAYPDWASLNMADYVQTETGRARKKVLSGKLERREASIYTNRGCPFSCTFCASHTTMGKSMRFRSVENVIEEMRQLHERYGVNLFIPEDDLFTANRKKVIPLLKAMKELGKTIPGFEIQFPNALSVNTLFDDVMDALIEAGMTVTNVAVESGSKYVQRHIIKKNCNLDRALEVVKYFRDHGVITRCYFIAGFPGETKEMMQETLDFAKQIKCDWAAFNNASPLRGTEMYQQFLDGGYIKDDINVWSTAFFQVRTFDTPEIKADELRQFTYRANLEVNFFSNVNIIEKKYDKAIIIFEEIIMRYSFHIFAHHMIKYCQEMLGQTEKAMVTHNHILELMRTDKRSIKMYKEYGESLEGLYDIDYIDDSTNTQLPKQPILDEESMRVAPLMSNT